jgi:hypothetical protein
MVIVDIGLPLYALPDVRVVSVTHIDHGRRKAASELEQWIIGQALDDARQPGQHCFFGRFSCLLRLLLQRPIDRIGDV